MTMQTEPVQQDADVQAPVDDFFFHFVDYLYRKRKLFISIGLLLLAGVFVSLGWVEYQQQQNEKRDLALFSIESELRVKETQNKALGDLESFIEHHPGTSQSRLARLYRSNVLSAQGDYLKAEFELDHLLAELDPKSGFFVVVQVNLSNLLRDQGKMKDALAILDKNQGIVMEDALLIEKAEIYFSEKNAQEVKNTLNRLLEAYPNSLYKQRAEQLLQAL